MAILTPTPRSAALWGPKLRRWLLTVDVTNLIVCSVAFVFGLANAIQILDNMKPYDHNYRYVVYDSLSFIRGEILSLAIVTPLFVLFATLMQMFFFAGYVLHPAVVVSTGCVFLGAWATVITFTIFDGSTGPFLDSVYVQNSNGSGSTPEYNVVSNALGVRISGDVFLVRFVFVCIAAILQIVYIGVGARAVKVWRRERRAKVTFYETFEDGNMPAGLRDSDRGTELESQVPPYTGPTSTPPRSVLASITSTAVGTDATPYYSSAKPKGFKDDKDDKELLP